MFQTVAFCRRKNESASATLRRRKLWRRSIVHFVGDIGNYVRGKSSSSEREVERCEGEGGETDIAVG